MDAQDDNSATVQTSKLSLEGYWVNEWNEGRADWHHPEVYP